MQTDTVIERSPRSITWSVEWMEQSISLQTEGYDTYRQVIYNKDVMGRIQC